MSAIEERLSAIEARLSAIESQLARRHDAADREARRKALYAPVQQASDRYVAAKKAYETAKQKWPYNHKEATATWQALEVAKLAYSTALAEYNAAKVT